MEVRGPEMRRRLIELGLPQDPSSGRIRFPSSVVEQAIADAPGSFTLYDRDGNPAADLGGDRVTSCPARPGSGCWTTGPASRLANSTDFVEYIRLADGLRNIAYLATAFSTNQDIEAQVSDAVASTSC